MKSARILAGTIALLFLAAVLLSAPLSVRADPVNRFFWVDGLDDRYPRENGPYLSRPIMTLQSSDIPLPELPSPVDFQHYATLTEMQDFLSQLQTAYPDLVQVSPVGQSWQGRDILLVRLGSSLTGDPDARPAMYLDGQHHAREAVSSEVVLYFAWYLASRYGSDPLVTRLLDTRTVYAIPCVNPDGNEIFLASDQRQRRTANPTSSDDDSDSLYDEDGRDGAGYGSFDVYAYTFDASWVAAHPTDPLASGWQSHVVQQRYAGIFDSQGNLIAQVDEDSDGKSSEDPPGGVDANRNYDSHWSLGDSNPRSEIYRGPNVFSEPETGAVRDTLLAAPNVVTALSFHSGGDMLLYPWAWSSTAELPLPDRCWYELLSRKGSQLTQANGFRGSLHTSPAQGAYPSPGSTLDWLYEQGLMAWVPETYSASSVSFVQRITTTNTYSIGISVGEAFNPSPTSIPLTTDRWLRWSLFLLGATPNVGLSSVSVRPGALELAIANDGLFPLDIAVEARTNQGEFSTTIAQLNAGIQTWSVPVVPSTQDQSVVVTLTATSTLGSAAGRRQIEVYEIEIDQSGAQVTRGNLEPFEDLGTQFGGWFADRQWDGVDYHLGPLRLSAGNLDVSVAASPPVVTRGEVVTYTVLYTSTCLCPMTNALVTTTLPAGTTYGGTVWGPGWLGPDTSGGTVVWNKAALQANASGQLVLTATADLAVPVSPDWILTDTVEIRATADVTPTNDLAATSNILQGLQVHKSHTPARLTAGWNLWYYIDVTNTASSPATNVTLRDTLSPWIPPYAVQPSSGGTFDGLQTVSWLIPGLGPGTAQRLWIKARTYSSAAGQCITDTVEADSDQAAPSVGTLDTACVEAAPPLPPTPTPVPSPTPTSWPGSVLVIQQGSRGHSEDTYLYRYAPDVNYCSSPLLKVGYRQTNLGLMSFDLSPLPPSATVVSATLEMWAVGWGGADARIGAYAVLRDISLCESTWNLARVGSPWSTPGCDGTTLDREERPRSWVTTAGIRRWYTFDLTGLVRQWVDGRLLNRGVLLRPEYSNSSFMLASAEYPDVTLRPRLIIRYR